ncbi:MAG: hypothetical protein R2699_04440 [Acidimicrobiales bacterium]|nr:hypothetical protein [Acidimicrobiales bacterium]MCB1259533.1 hypothetical protein [Acidimicrobiales bacterium]
MRRSLLIVVALTALAAGACGTAAETSAPPPTVPTVGSQAPGGDGVASGSATANSVAPTVPPSVEPTAAADPADPLAPGAGPAAVPGATPAPDAPPVTYDEAMLPWCSALGGPVDAIEQSAGPDGTMALPQLIEPLRASLAVAPEFMIEPTNRLIGVLERLKAAIDAGEVTDRDSMVRWGLVNLSAEEITSLQNDLFAITDVIGRNCPPT